LSPDAPTLAERLAGEGYTTAAFTTNAWLTSSLGFHRGFATWRHGDESFHHLLALAGFPDRPPARTADAVVDRALGWLDDAPPRGWFLWVHLLDPHLPYAHATDDLVAGLSDERLRSGLRLTEDIQRRTREGYAAEVAAADAALGRLVDALDARGVLRDGLVVLTADHGEELWDHGATGHGHSHHREVVQVPLVVAGAGLSAGERTDPVSLADVAGTLAAVAGLSADGGDLLSEATPERIVTTQGNAYFWQQRSAWGLGAHAIVSERDEVVRCWSPPADPTEQVELACPEGHLTAAAALAVEGPGEGTAAEVAEGALRALGYVE
jgi:arylsulfatase A-like enzyme